MNIVRCTNCGEIVDYDLQQTCSGCSKPLSTAPAAKRPRQYSAVQREASADIDHSKALLIAIVATAALGVSLIFLKDRQYMGAFLVVGLAAAVLYLVLTLKRKPDTAKVLVRRVPSARPTGPAYVGSSQSLGSSLEAGCGMVLKAIGIFIAVVVGLIALGLLILWISCMGSSWGHF